MDVNEFLAGLPAEGQEDARALAELMTRATGETPALWGSIIGFGSYHYRYDSGREGNSMRVGFAARKAALTLYLNGETDDALLARLGRHSVGKGCLYVKTLADVDAGVLEQVVAHAFAANRTRYPEDARSPTSAASM